MTSNRIDNLTLMAGCSILLPEIGLNINQPKLSDVGILGETDLYKGLSYFLIDKKKLSIDIEVSNFDLFMYVVNQDVGIQKLISDIFILTIDDLSNIKFLNNIIILDISGHDCIIDEPKFLIIKETYKTIFCLEEASAQSEYNPANEQARRIMEKLQKRKQQLSGASNEKKDDKIFSTLISILSIGSNNFGLRECLDMTVYQIYSLVKRFNLYEQYQMQTQALMQGAKDIELVEWTKQL